MTAKEQLATWLNSAHGTEVSLIKVLENHAKDARDIPMMHMRLEQHLEETRRHAKMVENCLSLLGEKPSTTKSILGNLTGMVQGASTGMFKDELIKNCLSDYAAEHFEIACYRSLVVAAEDLGEREIAALCREILGEEEAMAQWLADQIPETTRLMQQQLTHA